MGGGDSVIRLLGLWKVGGREGHSAFQMILEVRTPAPTSAGAFDSVLRASG